MPNDPGSAVVAGWVVCTIPDPERALGEARRVLRAGGAQVLRGEAVELLGRIIERQFGSLGAQPWYFHIPGETFIKKEAEEWPFVKKLLVPAGLSVGPKHELGYDQATGAWHIVNIGDCGPDDGTDDEFVALRTGDRLNTRRGGGGHEPGDPNQRRVDEAAAARDRGRLPATSGGHLWKSSAYR